MLSPMCSGVVGSLNAKFPPEWIERVRALRPTIVFAEGEDERVLKAAECLTNEGIARPLLLGRSERLRIIAKEAKVGLDAIGEIRDPNKSSGSLLNALADAPGFRRRGSKPETLVREVQDPLVQSALLVRLGTAQACVAGNTRTTADVLRAAIRVIGTAPETDVVTSSFLLGLGGAQLITFADCAVIPSPSPVELADIAVTSADTHRALTGEAPVVALLSFSTHGTAAAPEVEDVRSAVGLARQRRPDLEIGGELQFDAAYDPEVACLKSPNCKVAGRANVFVFPNLGAGNIAYKITRHLVGAAAYGPILQGLYAPMNDLSRGCSSEDVVGVSLIGALQALESYTPNMAKETGEVWGVGM